ncbi:hypothetical protein ACP_0807 [Acidobacterium capsulatum ATCC 51196]|uniref:Uncharacterized protein n=1 Tax=Acidobacterium capsulatum (strain ATCC 51196 / DSM 11244 / BCRC 80197 / JCM 7670 / NBRC 15755 / NCIMB 13165 / 161) TaxID=240015 RepID=C1F2Q8_ACIC5|nr:hypothetical protein ACP_0807 [Acidobacterium capsulatum ATCC 51196]
MGETPNGNRDASIAGILRSHPSVLRMPGTPVRSE